MGSPCTTVESMLQRSRSWPTNKQTNKLVKKTQKQLLTYLRDFWRHFGLCRTAAHSDCCFFAPCTNILTYLLTYLLYLLTYCQFLMFQDFNHYRTPLLLLVFMTVQTLSRVNRVWLLIAYSVDWGIWTLMHVIFPVNTEHVTLFSTYWMQLDMSAFICVVALRFIMSCFCGPWIPCKKNLRKVS